jgi:predicted hotdog family 3-hydroxylacyl-ACP dehydratase
MAAPRILPAVLARQGGPETVFTLAGDADLVGFQGHFPGHPVLPGVVQIHWAAGFGAEAFGPLGAFCGLAQVKFHQTIGPGRIVDLCLAFDPARGQLRFACQGGPDLLSSGVLRFRPDAGPGPDRPAGGAVPPEPGAPAPLPLLLPHQPPMRLLDALLEADDRHCTALARVDPAAWYAGPDGSAPGWIGLEWMAQAIAAHQGLRHREQGGAPRVGYLLGTRAYACDLAAFPDHAAVAVEAVVQETDHSGLSVYACAIRYQGCPVAQAVLRAFEP